MEKSQQKTIRKRRPTYQDQIASLNEVYTTKLIGLNESLRDSLTQYSAALSGRYESIQKVNEHRSKIIRGRTYTKRLKFAEMQLQDIGSKLREGGANQAQISDISNYVRSLYQVAIRDNKAAQKHLETGGFRNSKSYVMPAMVEYYTVNSTQSENIRQQARQLGSQVNSLELRLGVNGKSLRVKKPVQESEYKAAMSTGVARVPASQAIRPAPEEMKAPIAPVNVPRSPLQKSYAEVFDRALHKMNNSDADGSTEILYYTPMRPNVTPASEPKRESYEPYTAVTRAPTIPRTKIGWKQRFMKYGLQVVTGLALLVLPVSSTSPLPAKVARSTTYHASSLLQQVEQLPRERIASDSTPAETRLHIPEPIQSPLFPEESTIRTQLYDYLLRRKNTPIDLPTDPQPLQYHEAMMPLSGVRTQAGYIKLHSWKYQA